MKKLNRFFKTATSKINFDLWLSAKRGMLLANNYITFQFHFDNGNCLIYLLRLDALAVAKHN